MLVFWFSFSLDDDVVFRFLSLLFVINSFEFDQFHRHRLHHHHFLRFVRYRNQFDCRHLYVIDRVNEQHDLLRVDYHEISKHVPLSMENEFHPEEKQKTRFEKEKGEKKRNELDWANP